MVVRQVRHNGEIKWRGRLLYLSETLRQEAIGLKQVDERQWEIYYGFHLLGYLDDGEYKITSPKQWHGET